MPVELCLKEQGSVDDALFLESWPTWRTVLMDVAVLLARYPTEAGPEALLDAPPLASIGSEALAAIRPALRAQFERETGASETCRALQSRCTLALALCEAVDRALTSEDKGFRARHAAQFVRSLLDDLEDASRLPYGVWIP